ncbi:ead/Ea22-like family protein [Salmonella enterica subsp. enterica serovar Typhimurium]|nr:ead/Ea22-like family protein [Salmonella enterica subsp. enterica serovar Typhimurium]
MNIDKQALREELSNPAIGSKDHLRKLALSLLDELDVKEEQRANWFQMAQKLGEDLDAAEKRIAEQREYYEGVIADGSKRIAELERSETQLINERDSAESALNDAYKAVMGQAPEWSNWFSFENAIDEIELVCELWRNQTDDVIQFRQRIQELEAKLANPVLLPKTNGYWNEQEKAYEEAITLAKRQVRLAGFRCEGDE